MLPLKEFTYLRQNLIDDINLPKVLDNYMRRCKRIDLDSVGEICLMGNIIFF